MTSASPILPACIGPERGREECRPYHRPGGWPLAKTCRAPCLFVRFCLLSNIGAVCYTTDEQGRCYGYAEANQTQTQFIG